MQSEYTFVIADVVIVARLTFGLCGRSIIVRPCPWDSEPVLKDLQALPKHGQAVITFPEETGERDQVWTNIAKVVESRAKALRKALRDESQRR